MALVCPAGKSPIPREAPRKKQKLPSYTPPAAASSPRVCAPLTWLLGQRSKYPILHGPKGKGKHPWKAEVTEGDTEVTAETITNWYKNVYEPSFASA